MYRLSQTNYTHRNVFEHLSTAGSTESTAVRLLQPHSSDVEHEVREEQINIDGNENYPGTHHEELQVDDTGRK